MGDRVTFKVCGERLDLLVVRLKGEAGSQDCGGQQEVKQRVQERQESEQKETKTREGLSVCGAGAKDWLF